VIVVLDTNVFVSAIVTPRGPADQLVIAAGLGALDVVLSPMLVAELRSVLARSKFRRLFSESEATEYVDALMAIGRVVTDPPVESGLTRDAADDYLVALARAVGADLLVSGDKDLLEAGLGPLVVSPRTALERLG